MRKTSNSSRNRPKRPAVSAIRREGAQRGFTLVELCIFAAIMLLLVLGCVGMMEGAFKSSSAAYNITQIEDAARESLSTMIRQLRVATSIDATSTNESLTLSGDLDGNGVGESVNFSVVDGALCQTVPGYSAEQWVPYVDSVTFTYFQPGAGDNAVIPGAAGWTSQVGRVSVVIQLSAKGQGITTERSYEASVALRNTM